MVFSSLTFLLVFLPISLLVYYLIPREVRNYWLLAVSLLFYYWGEHDFVWIMAASILCNYLLALLIDAVERPFFRKAVLALDVTINLGILIYNKYMNLLTGLLNRHVSASIQVTDIVLPIGISFFTFQAMSYVVDVYRKDVPVQKNLFKLGLYISFFPQLVAGPIVRYNTIQEQIDGRRTTLRQFCDGTARFMLGFCEKILLSNQMSVIADQAFSQAAADKASISVAFAWIGAVAYSLQILFDFAGYSSMAIGLGKMFGFEFMENFNFPYIASSITDFWRRWHISLSQWFRDYVYIPLGGSRVDKKWKVYRNLLVVWLLTGIWHGANFTFVAWGLGYFVLLCFEKLTRLPQRVSGGFRVLYRIFTLLCVILEWVVFRAESLTAAGNYYLAMIGAHGNPLVDLKAVRYLADYKLVFAVSILCCTPIFHGFQTFMERKFKLGGAVAFVYQSALVGLMLLSISSIVMGNNNPFIYFNF